ncbi:hypothetical protein GCM10010994_18720 [Chelatococcus reniformis]|uniref:Uncharacterized protein n=1 Tax=Chelatococcus reniformis TaxID=1494448 RepID=A0A916U6D5_9HYPH|nr:hypothetical protein GCM10010994_18720 [Chelatococcus reniformis]
MRRRLYSVKMVAIAAGAVPEGRCPICVLSAGRVARRRSGREDDPERCDDGPGLALLDPAPAEAEEEPPRCLP